ncbi:uncharacterized protein LOC144294277 [Canis aureus]
MKRSFSLVEETRPEIGFRSTMFDLALVYKAFDCCIARKNGIVNIPSKMNICLFSTKCIFNCCVSMPSCTHDTYCNNFVRQKKRKKKKKKEEEKEKKKKKKKRKEGEEEKII